jgi:hypothetical protein
MINDRVNETNGISICLGQPRSIILATINYRKHQCLFLLDVVDLVVPEEGLSS